MVRPVVLLAASLLMALLLAACSGGSDGGDVERATPGVTAPRPPPIAGTEPPPGATPSPAATVAATLSPTAAAGGVPMQVFFSRHPQSDDDPAQVFPVERVSPTAGVARFGVEQLLVGSTADEQGSGYYSEWAGFELGADSTRDGDDFTVAIEAGTATVAFCRTVLLHGVLSDARALAELEATLTQWSTVGNVIVLNDGGHCMFDLSGLDLCKEQ